MTDRNQDDIDMNFVNDFHEDDAKSSSGGQRASYLQLVNSNSPAVFTGLPFTVLKRYVEEVGNRTETILKRFATLSVNQAVVRAYFGEDITIEKEEDLCRLCAKHIYTLTNLFKAYYTKIESGTEADARPDIIIQLSKGYKSVELVKKFVSSMFSAVSYSSDERKETPEDVFAGATLGCLLGDKWTPTQRLIFRCLDKLESLGLARYRGRVCREIKVYRIRDVDGNEIYVQNSEYETNQHRYSKMDVQSVYKTHTWEDACDIEEIVYDLTRRSECIQSFMDFTKCQNLKGIVNFLKHCKDHSFPELQPNYNFRSFTNGILDLSIDGSAFYPYSDVQKNYIPANLVCAKHYERPFPKGFLGNRYLDIATPHFSKLFRDQRLSEHVIFCCFALLGRCLYTLNETDKWQTILVIKGVAQSGKSTIGNTLRKFYKHEDVAVLSSNIEGKFGLRPIADKRLFICYEMARDFGLPKCDVLNVIEGGWMNLPGKHVEAITKKWKVPGLFIGNMIADWNDAGGSMSRRLLTLLMQTKITAADMCLEEKIDREFPLILYKMYKAYKILRKNVGTRSIWDELPNFFLKVRKDVAAATNPIKTFLLDKDQVILDPGLEVARVAFDDAARQYLRRGNIKFRSDDLNTALRDFKIGIRVKRGTCNGSHFTGSFYIGCGLRRTEETQAYEAKENEELDDMKDDIDEVGCNDSDYEGDEGKFATRGVSSIIAAHFTGVVNESKRALTVPLRCKTKLPRVDERIREQEDDNRRSVSTRANSHIDGEETPVETGSIRLTLYGNAGSEPALNAGSDGFQILERHEPE